MLEWSEFVEKLKDDINRYCEQNKINFDESISYLKSFIEKEDNYSEKGLNKSFLPNFIKMYDSSLDINDKKNCIDRLTRYEPFLRKICFMRFPDKISEIENLCAAELIKRLELIEDKNFWDKNNNDYPSNSFAHHLFIMYMAKNSSSHHWEKLNERELYEMRYTIAIFYIEVISKLQNILRAASCLPEETVEYYARYIDKNGIPYGIRKLTEEQVKHTNSSYKFIIKESKIIKVVHINSLGYPYESDGTFLNPVIQDVYYPDENTIKIKCTNSTGKKINFIKEFKRDINKNSFDILNYYNGDGSSSYHLLNDELDQYLQDFNVSHTNSYKANISSIKLERNKDGFIIKERFLRYHGENILQSDKDNNYGYEYEINTNGLITKKFFLDKNGKKKKYSKGICFEEIKYNSLFETEEVSIHNRHNDSKYIYKYDDFGNLVQSTVFSGNKRIEKLKLIYNSIGQLIERSFFNGDSFPYYCNNPFHLEVRTYDKNGYVTSTEYYGINKNDKVIADTNNVKCWKKNFKYDNFGFEVSEEYYDCDGNPVLGCSGSFKIEYDYDSSGNLIEERYFGLDGKLKCDNSGVAIVRKRYKNNELIEELYFDEKHTPISNTELYHKVTFQYYKGEEAENIEEISYFGTDSKPINTISGFSKKKIIYNGRGLITDEFFFNEKGNEGDINGLYHALFEYGSEGNCIKKSFFNNEKKLIPIISEIGSEPLYAIEEINRVDLREERLYKNEKESIVKKYIKIFDVNENIISDTEYQINELKEKHIITVKRKYDDADRCIEESYFNESGEIIETPSGGYYIRFEYWDDNKEKCRKYYDKDNNLIFMKGFKCAYWIKKYDIHNNITERFFFDINDKPVQIENNHYVGYTINYDSFNRPIAQYYLDKNKKPTYYILINYIDDTLCKIIYNNYKQKLEDFAKYEVNTNSSGTVFSFDSNRHKHFKIRTNEFQ